MKPHAEFIASHEVETCGDPAGIFLVALSFADFSL